MGSSDIAGSPSVQLSARLQDQKQGTASLEGLRHVAQSEALILESLPHNPRPSIVARTVEVAMEVAVRYEVGKRMRDV